EELQVQWVPGPTTVVLGADVAQLTLGEGHAFAGAEDTRKIQAAIGNTITNDEVGLVTSQDPAQRWAILFEYEAGGYVRDDGRGRMDADASLESIREGTEEANKHRKEKGVPAIHVVGWDEAPHYDARTHNLVWAIRGRSDDGRRSSTSTSGCSGERAT